MHGASRDEEVSKNYTGNEPNSVNTLVSWVCQLGSFCSLFIFKMAPGLGYGLIWNSGPVAVVSTPVLASPVCNRPVDHVPLSTK